MPERTDRQRITRWTGLDPKAVYFACDAFIEGRKAEWIRDELGRLFGVRLTRTQVYQVVAEGRGRGYFQLTPPLDEALARRMEAYVRGARGDEASRRPNRGREITVVSQGYTVSLEHVAVRAAQKALEVITAIHDETTKEAEAAWKAKQRRRDGETMPTSKVHVGFGAGLTTTLVARFLSERLRALATPPPVVWHALSSGFNVADPAVAPVAFFNFFHGIPGMEYRGLFAPAYVEPPDAKVWRKTLDSPGVKEAFDAKGDIQVIITSLASRWDDHGELNRYMAGSARGEAARRMLDDQQRRLGDVLYRPFSATGAITTSGGVRPVTLFEIEELVAFAADPKKAIILVAGPCGECGRSRSDALHPLLVQPALEVWSHLVVDDETAANCVERDGAMRPLDG